MSIPRQPAELKAGDRVEWRDGPDMARGTLVKPDNPWWLVVADDGGRQTLVKAFALFPEGGLRREQIADAIQMAAWRAGDRSLRWSDFLACADAVIALDGGTP
jgi:hypothetical protein